MAKGKVSINSEVANNVITYLTNATQCLDGDVTSKLTSSFQPLVDLGFASNCLSKVQEQVKSLLSQEQSLISSISSHLSDVSKSEDGLNKGFNNRIGSSGGGGGGSSTTPVTPGDQEGSEIDVDDEEDGKKIKVDGFKEMIDALTDTEKNSLLKLLEVNKDANTSIKDLLFDTKYSEELFKLLKKILGEKVEFDELSADDIKQVQKILLESIVNSETTNTELKTNSILVVQEYLKSISSKNNISASDLLFNDSYKNVLKDSLKNLYNGDVDDSVSDSTVFNFRDYIDPIAKEKNISAHELIDNYIELVI